jgi:ferric-dicitrate binding protein FerR (iron transport regulator)
VNGEVSRLRDNRPWAISGGERVPTGQLISTGKDGYAKFYVTGGSSFELYANSKVIFRENPANAGDLLDLVSGRVRIHLHPGIGSQQYRVYTPVATISAHNPATIALAIDEDDTLRVDVIEGEVRVQHALLPSNEPVSVKAIDAILVQRNQPISRKVDRGSLYRYSDKVWSAITFGHGSSHGTGPIEGGRLLSASQTVLLPEFCSP